jgi:hypothetical protein
VSLGGRKARVELGIPCRQPQRNTRIRLVCVAFVSFALLSRGLLSGIAPPCAFAAQFRRMGKQKGWGRKKKAGAHRKSSIVVDVTTAPMRSLSSRRCRGKWVLL